MRHDGPERPKRSLRPGKLVDSTHAWAGPPQRVTLSELFLRIRGSPCACWRSGSMMNGSAVDKEVAESRSAGHRWASAKTGKWYAARWHHLTGIGECVPALCVRLVVRESLSAQL